MKIVHCFFTMKTGGSQILAVDMLNEMRQSHDVSLIIVNDQWSEDLLKQLHPEVAVYHINRKAGGRNPLPILQLNYLLVKLNPDIIHCHERDLIRIIKHQRAKTVYTVHDVGVPTASFAKYDSLVAISDSVAQDVLARSGLKTIVINNGIPFKYFRQRTTYQLLAGEPVRLVQVSRLMHEKKGQDVLIQALAILINRDPALNITLDFVGSGNSATYLADLARSLNLGARVRFLGEQGRDWVRENLSTYHVLVQPSRYEGFGLTVVEGFAAGLPVLASNIEGPAEIIQGLPAGLLFEREDASACADSLGQLIRAYTTGQIEQPIQQTRSLTEKKFSIETLVSSYLALYRQLAPNRRPVPVAYSA